jgi:SAM-dependent methyltransferase
MKCRHCGLELSKVFLDLGYAPPSNAYLSDTQLKAAEVHYPLRLLVCTGCWLVQTEDYASADTFFSPDYAYFSSTSKSWLAHAAAYVDMITDRLGLDRQSFVVEIASNDGYLLRNFVASGVPCLGIEPTHSTAAAAEALGIPVRREFFGEDLGRELARDGQRADLVCGNNVYAHVPDINDFTRGIAAVLKPEGVVTLEFPHLLRMVENSEFDTVYHEHFSYLSLIVVERIFRSAGLRIIDVEELPTHGHSLRVYGCLETASWPTSPAVARVLDEERAKGVDTAAFYDGFQTQAIRIKNDLLDFLLKAMHEGKRVIGYGAAAKGNTLLNYAGIRPDLIPAVFDAAPSKQNKYLPGSHIPIMPPAEIGKARPDYVLILPWNLSAEIMLQLNELRAAGTSFVIAVPHLSIV